MGAPLVGGACDVTAEQRRAVALVAPAGVAAAVAEAGAGAAVRAKVFAVQRVLVANHVVDAFVCMPGALRAGDLAGHATARHLRLVAVRVLGALVAPVALATFAADRP